MELKQRVIAIDYKKVARNAAIFLAPAVLLILINLQNGSDYQQIANIVYLWLLNALVDLVRKFIATNGN
jgi:hypothetical protein